MSTEQTNAQPEAKRTKEQRRAASAWRDVAEVTGEAVRKSYGSTVKKMPMTILTNGLGQTLAFLRAKATPKQGKKPSPENLAHDHAYKQVSRWVTKDIYNVAADVNLLQRIIGVEGHDGGSDSNTYRRATAETLAYVGWLKRFVEAQGWGDEG
jgi:CRISPR-associated protein Cmr5